MKTKTLKRTGEKVSRLTVQAPVELIQKIDDHAKQKGRSRSGVVIYFLEKSINGIENAD